MHFNVQGSDVLLLSLSWHQRLGPVSWRLLTWDNPRAHEREETWLMLGFRKSVQNKINVCNARCFAQIWQSRLATPQLQPRLFSHLLTWYWALTRVWEVLTVIPSQSTRQPRQADRRARRILRNPSHSPDYIKCSTCFSVEYSRVGERRI